MKRILSTVLSFVLVLSLLLTGCSGAKNDTNKADAGKTETNKNPKVMRVYSSSEPGSLHPGKAQGTHESWPLDHLMEGLTKKTPDGKIDGGMAKDWKVSQDGLTYTFNLRDNIKWSNGDPVTAQDFEFAWKYCLNPATASKYAFQLYYIAGAEAYNTSKETDAAKLKALEDAVAVKSINDKTLEIKLAKPTPYFLELLSFYTYYPVDKKVQTANKDWQNEASSYVSNGAFKMSEWKHKESITLARNDNYYDKDKIKLDQIVFVINDNLNTVWQMYKSGDLDLDHNLPTEILGQLKASNSPELVIGNELATYFYRFNTTKKPFNNVKVRMALAMAIDRKTIVENITQGGQRPAFGMTPPGLSDEKGDYQKNLGDQFSEDLVKAKQLLDEGLKEEKVDKLSFSILYNTDASHKKIAEAIQDMWKKNLGLDVKLENVDFQVKIDREHALQYDVSRAGWIGDYADPMTFLDMWDSKSTQNDTGWKNPEYDKLIERAKVTLDPASRFKDIRDAEKLLMKDIPIMPIYFYTRPYVAKPYVKGLFKPVNKYPMMHYVDIQK